MTTDHTSESSWEADTVPAGQKSFVTPAFDVAAEIGPEPEQEPEREPLIESASALGQDLELDQDLECEPDAADGAESVAESLRESLQSGGVDAIEFRVSRPGTPVRRLRLTGNRYTFGSAEGCSIRLTDRDLRPMHAVLIREASRTLVRAYSVPVDVNGTRITEAELHPGDVLSLGAYRFELLDDEEASARRSQSASEDARPWRSIFEASQSRPLGSFSFAGNQLGLGAGLSSSEDVIWKERLKREMEQWRERQVDCDRRENRCEEREAKLRDRETELWSRAEDLSRRESHLQSQEATTFQLDEAEARLKQLAAQLELLQDDRGSDLAAQQEQLAASERSAKELRLQVQELQQGLSEATEESARLRVDYEEAFASVVQLESIIAQGSQSSDKDRETWEAEADELHASVERLSLELGKANRELDELRDANVQLTARLDDMQRQRDEARADAEARPTPESFESLQEE